jgi:hypothetical protein
MEGSTYTRRPVKRDRFIVMAILSLSLVTEAFMPAQGEDARGGSGSAAAATGRPHLRPTVPENLPIRGDLSLEFGFDQQPTRR